jgi:MFS family permease
MRFSCPIGMMQKTFSCFQRKGTDTLFYFLRALKNPSFALLWSGQTISRLGDSFYTVALAWWVLEKTGSAAAMGLVLICSSVPMLLFLLLGGVVVDRFSRLHLMLASDLVRALIVVAVAVLAFSQRLEVWHVLVMSTLFGTVDAFFYPAYTAIIPEVVAVSDLPSANSLRTLSLQLTGIVGAASAGVIIAVGGTPLAFAFDAISFAISALCLIAFPRKAALTRSISVDVESGVLHDLRQGIQTVIASPWLWISIAIAGLSNLTLSGPLEAALPLLVKQRFGTNAQIYGFLMALSALGSVLAAIWIGYRKRLRRRGYLAYGAWLVASLMLFFMGLPLPIVAMSLAICVSGAALDILNLTWANSLQELVSPDLLGRVASVDALGSYALLPVGYALAGIAADHFGASAVFIAGGIISALVIALGLLHPAIRAVD